MHPTGESLVNLLRGICRNSAQIAERKINNKKRQNQQRVYKRSEKVTMYHMCFWHDWYFSNVQLIQNQTDKSTNLRGQKLNKMLFEHFIISTQNCRNTFSYKGIHLIHIVMKTNRGKQCYKLSAFTFSFFFFVIKQLVSSIYHTDFSRKYCP